MGLFDELIERKVKEAIEAAPAKATENELYEALNRLKTRHELTPGMLVQWKPGLKNRNWPAYGEPALYMAKLGGPHSVSENAEVDLSDVVLLTKRPDGALHPYAFEAARLEPYIP